MRIEHENIKIETFARQFNQQFNKNHAFGTLFRYHYCIGIFVQC